MRQTFLFLLAFLPALASFGQHIIPVTVTSSTDSAYLELMQSVEDIRDDDVMNERILDLVDVYTVDSIYARKTERHQVAGAQLARMVGVRWVTIRYTREKLVGTIHRQSISGKEQFTEYDVNFDLVPHLDEYIQLAYDGYQAQLAKRKGLKKAETKNKIGKPPFVYPDKNTDLTPYKIHCECTPNRDSREFLDDYFYPTIRPNSLTAHYNFGEPHPSVGLYGPFISDCNHRCHPEIHPYEWYWWLDVSPLKQHEANEKIWWVGFLRDVSNRFKHWSYSPRSGEIAIPFSFSTDHSSYSIHVDHQHFDAFSEEGISSINLPETTYSFNEIERSFQFDHSSLSGHSLDVTSNFPITSSGVRYWIGDVNLDESAGIVTGKLHIAASVEDIYTLKVTTKSE